MDAVQNFFLGTLVGSQVVVLWLLIQARVRLAKAEVLAAELADAVDLSEGEQVDRLREQEDS